jgi:hypothetical protein
MATYEQQRTSALAAVVGLIAPNGVGAINGQVHQDNEVNQTNDYYDNLVAYDGFTYRFVRVNDNNATNAVSLQAAYDAAKLLTPGGSALSATNRVAVLLPPGTYSFGTGVFLVDTEFIDFVGLGPNPSDVILFSAHVDPDGQGTVTKSVDDVTFMNLTIHNEAETAVNFDATDASAFAPQVVAPNEVLKNVRITVASPTTAWPTRLEQAYSGVYTDVFCQSFSDQTFNVASGVFTRVTSGTNAFVSASGTFTDCSCVSGWQGATGTFNRCSARSGFFNVGATAKMYNCTGTSDNFITTTTAGSYIENCGSTGTAFVTGGSLAGTHVGCYGGSGSFSAATLSGTFINCRSDGNAFGVTSGAVLSGTFIGCVAGAGFGLGASSVLSGSFVRCSGGSNLFGSGTGSTLSGIFTDCVGGNNCFGQLSSTLSGTFTNCTARSQSFGYGASSATISTLTGTFRNCHGNDDCFGRNTSISSTALFEYCSGQDRCFGQGANGLSGLGIAGTFRYCAGRDSCFGAGMSASIKTTGTFEHCIARNGSFASGAGMEASGTFRHCIGGNQCFGYAASPGTGEAPIASGLFESCFGGDYCFGSADASVAGTEASGVFVGCRAGDGSFGSVYLNPGTALASGTFIDCDGGQDSFSLQANGNGEMSGTMINCRLMNGATVGASSCLSPVTGRMENCQIKVSTAGASAILAGSGAVIVGCTLIGNGAGFAVTASAPGTPATITHCRGSANGIDAANVTNSIGTPYNVFNAAFA